MADWSGVVSEKHRDVHTLRRDSQAGELILGLGDPEASRAYETVTQFLDRVRPQTCFVTIETSDGELVSIQFDWFELTEEGPQPRQEAVDFAQEDSGRGLRRPPRRFLH